MAGGLTEEQAYRALQQTARANRQTIRDTARAVIKQNNARSEH